MNLLNALLSTHITLQDGEMLTALPRSVWRLYGEGPGYRYQLTVHFDGSFQWAISASGRGWSRWLRRKGATPEMVIEKLQLARGWAAKQAAKRAA